MLATVQVTHPIEYSSGTTLLPVVLMSGQHTARCSIISGKCCEPGYSNRLREVVTSTIPAPLERFLCHE
jgi:hypothetical protein